MILKGLLAPYYLLQNFSENQRKEKKYVKGDTEDNPQLSDPFLLSCQCFFSRDHKPKLKDRRSKVFFGMTSTVQTSNSVPFSYQKRTR